MGLVQRQCDVMQIIECRVDFELSDAFYIVARVPHVATIPCRARSGRLGLRGQSLIGVLRQLRAGFPSRPEAFPASVILCGLRDVCDYKAASGGDPNRLGGGPRADKPARAKPSRIASGVSSTPCHFIRPAHFAHTFTSMANTCRSSHAHGLRRARLTSGSSNSFPKSGNCTRFGAVFSFGGTYGLADATTCSRNFAFGPNTP
jgi:hypothetical protein